MVHQSERAKGYTLIELLVVIAIVFVLLAMSVEGFRLFAVGVGGDASARRVLKVLEEAHARTLSADGDTQYGVFFDTSSVTLFAGDAYASGAPSNETTTLHQATISDISLADGGSEVVFSRIRGNPSATGTITIQETRDTSIVRVLEVHATGLSEITP